MLANRVRMGRVRYKNDQELDFVFGEVMREDMGGMLRRTYETNEVIVNYNCTLFFDESDTPSASFYWVKNGSELRAYNTDTATWENSSIILSEGDKLKFRFTTWGDPEDSTTSVLDIDLKLSNAENPIVSNLYCVYSGVGCYLTTAMVGYFSKADDGIELTAMRKLREKYKYKHSITLAEYERVSPHIIHGIEQSGNRNYWYSEIKKIVDNIVIWVTNNEWERAEVAYLSLYYKLKRLFYREVRE